MDIYREWFVCADFDDGDNGPVVVLWTGDDMGGEGLTLSLLKVFTPSQTFQVFLTSYSLLQCISRTPACVLAKISSIGGAATITLVMS